MTLHKEGTTIMLTTIAALVVINLIAFWLIPQDYKAISYGILGLSVVFMILVTQFFRVPNRVPILDDNSIVCPADGKVVAIEEVHEHEYFNDKRIQVSVFMSPLNVHVNWFPISGIVKYAKYHAGLFLVAWHPKSSTDNERTTIVVEHAVNKKQVLFRQIAGAVARRIVYYAKENEFANQTEQFGFIKFGSRIDLLLPLDTNIKVEIGDKVKGQQSIIGTFN
jgi:phosphatidylserine decarboxylase